MKLSEATWMRFRYNSNLGVYPISQNMNYRKASDAMRELEDARLKYERTGSPMEIVLSGATKGEKKQVWRFADYPALMTFLGDMKGPNFKKVAVNDYDGSVVIYDGQGKRVKLLEVPVGTGVLTMPLYKSLPDADVTCLDYSTDMMAHAEKRATAMHIGNVRFQQGDVGKLPFADESFDIVLSLNGFHAFPDKEAVYSETCRVLKRGGVFCGCFYIAGEFARTDFFVKKMYVPKGFFTAPFETKESLESRLNGLYQKTEVHAVRAEGTFRCVK